MTKLLSIFHIFDNNLILKKEDIITEKKNMPFEPVKITRDHIEKAVQTMGAELILCPRCEGPSSQRSQGSSGFLWCNEAIMNLCPDTPPLEAGATGKGLRSRSYVTRMNGKEYYACPRCGALFRNAKSRLRLRLM